MNNLFSSTISFFSAYKINLAILYWVLENENPIIYFIVFACTHILEGQLQLLTDAIYVILSILNCYVLFYLQGRFQFLTFCPFQFIFGSYSTTSFMKEYMPVTKRKSSIKSVVLFSLYWWKPHPYGSSIQKSFINFQIKNWYS